MSDYGKKTLGDIIVLHTKLIDIPLRHSDYIFVIKKIIHPCLYKQSLQRCQATLSESQFGSIRK